MAFRILSLVTLCFAATLAVSAAHPDQVTNLPGLTTQPSFKHYSGYLKGLNGTKLHYWFVESQNDPSNDPVLMWMNGGPGCSSMDGMLQEHGPFLVNHAGTGLEMNNYSWNLKANVLYLEAPAGVGFSYSPGQTQYYADDVTTAYNNYRALLVFFQEYPEFSTNDFYISGESYGGIYVPTLTTQVIAGNSDPAMAYINLKGFAIGNGLLSYQLNDNSLIPYAYYHGFIGEQLWNELKVCNGEYHTPSTSQCEQAVNQVMNVVYNDGLNFYGWNSDCEKNSDPRIVISRSHMYRKFLPHTPPATPSNKTKLQSDVPCIWSSNLDTYLNTPEVRTAIHIDPEDKRVWSICKGEEDGLHYTRQINDSYTLLPNMLKSARGLVYNGDTDMACNYLGDEWAVDRLKLRSTEDRRTWHVGGQVAGFVQTYANLSYTTVKGCGHMVPQPGIGNPSFALHMIQTFLAGEPL